MRENHHYILNEDGNPVAVGLEEWAEWFGEHKEERIMKQTRVFGIWVSTIFLGLNHNFFGNEPLIFETMIFGGTLDQYQDRYSTKEQALRGHREAVWKVIKTLPLSLTKYLKFKFSKEGDDRN